MNSVALRRFEANIDRTATCQRYDFAERLGGCTDPLMAEVDSALRELWNARCGAVLRPPTPEGGAGE